MNRRAGISVGPRVSVALLPFLWLTPGHSDRPESLSDTYSTIQRYSLLELSTLICHFARQSFSQSVDCEFGVSVILSQLARVETDTTSCNFPKGHDRKVESLSVIPAAAIFSGSNAG